MKHEYCSFACSNGQYLYDRDTDCNMLFPSVSSFEVVKVIYDKILDMTGKNQWVEDLLLETH